MSSDTVRRKHVRKASPKRKAVSPKRKAAVRKASPKRKAAVRKASPKRKAAFGGYVISFADREETVEQVFGKKPITPSEMTKKIWDYVKSKNLSKS